MNYYRRLLAVRKDIAFAEAESNDRLVLAICALFKGMADRDLAWVGRRES